MQQGRIFTEELGHRAPYCNDSTLLAAQLASAIVARCRVQEFVGFSGLNLFPLGISAPMSLQIFLTRKLRPLHVPAARSARTPSFSQAAPPAVPAREPTKCCFALEAPPRESKLLSPAAPVQPQANQPPGELQPKHPRQPTGDKIACPFNREAMYRSGPI